MILTRISLRFLENIGEFRTKSQNSCFKTRDFEPGFSPGFPHGIPQNRSLAPILGNPEFSNSGIPGMEQGCNTRRMLSRINRKILEVVRLLVKTPSR